MGLELIQPSSLSHKASTAKYIQMEISQIDKIVFDLGAYGAVLLVPVLQDTDWHGRFSLTKAFSVRLGVRLTFYFFTLTGKRVAKRKMSLPYDQCRA
jgi:hypothetical protein